MYTRSNTAPEAPGRAATAPAYQAQGRFLTWRPCSLPAVPRPFCGPGPIKALCAHCQPHLSLAGVIWSGSQALKLLGLEWSEESTVGMHWALSHLAAQQGFCFPAAAQGCSCSAVGVSWAGTPCQPSNYRQACLSLGLLLLVCAIPPSTEIP